VNRKSVIIAVLVLLATLGLVGILGGRSTAAEVVYPVQNGCSRVTRSLAARCRALWDHGRLADENRRLSLAVDALRMVQADNDALQAENARLRALLGLTRDGSPTNAWLAAPVLSRGGATGGRDVLRLARGSLDGVTVGAAVAVPDGLVGRIDEVSPRTSLVRLISDPTVRVACTVETGDDAYGSVSGILMGGRTRTISPEAEGTLFYLVEPLRLRHLKRDLVLPPRARIITSGLGGVYPRGLQVGFLIDGTREDESKLEREGDVVPAVDFASLEDVFIRREN